MARSTSGNVVSREARRDAGERGSRDSGWSARRSGRASRKLRSRIFLRSCRPRPGMIFAPDRARGGRPGLERHSPVDVLERRVQGLSMAAPSSRTLQRHANEAGHQAGTLEKVPRQPDLLQETARDRVLADRPALKGGRRSPLHLGLDRLPVDIDLNHVGALDRSAMEAERRYRHRARPAPHVPGTRHSPQA